MGTHPASARAHGLHELQCVTRHQDNSFLRRRGKMAIWRSSTSDVGAYRKQLEEQERADLLSRRSGAPDWQSEVGSGVSRCSCTGADMNRVPRRRLNLPLRSAAVAEAAPQELLMIDVAPQMAAEAAVRGSVGTSRRVLDEAYETGTAILGSMASQRDTLKVHGTAHCVWPGTCNSSAAGHVTDWDMDSVLLQAAQRRALDVINSIGLSDSLLRVIDRRQRMVRWIVYGGMVSWPPCRRQKRAHIVVHICVVATAPNVHFSMHHLESETTR